MPESLGDVSGLDTKNLPTPSGGGRNPISGARVPNPASSNDKTDGREKSIKNDTTNDDVLG